MNIQTRSHNTNIKQTMKITGPKVYLYLQSFGSELERTQARELVRQYIEYIQTNHPDTEEIKNKIIQGSIYGEMIVEMIG